QSFEAGGGDPPAGTKATLRPSDRAGSIPSTSPTVPLASETGPGATGAAQASAAVDVLPLRRIDHVRLFVGNARQSAYFYRNAFGFDVIAYAGLETRVRHESGYVLRQGQITFVLVSPLSGQHPESQRLIQHGDGLIDLALAVDH